MTTAPRVACRMEAKRRIGVMGTGGAQRQFSLEVHLTQQEREEETERQQRRKGTFNQGHPSPPGLDSWSFESFGGEGLGTGHRFTPEL